MINDVGIEVADGISLNYLQRIKEKFPNVSTAELCQIIVRGMKEFEFECSFLAFMKKISSNENSQLRQAVGAKFVPFSSKDISPATIFISHAWAYKFKDLVDSILFHFQFLMRLDPIKSEEVFVWIDIFSWNQHHPIPDYLAFKSVIEQCQTFLLVLSSYKQYNHGEDYQNNVNCWENPLPFKRMWCLYEILLAFLYCDDFHFVLPPDQMRILKQTLFHNIESHRISNFYEISIVKNLINFRILDAECTKEEDFINIRAIINRSTELPTIHDILQIKIEQFVIDIIISHYRSKIILNSDNSYLKSLLFFVSKKRKNTEDEFQSSFTYLDTLAPVSYYNLDDSDISDNNNLSKLIENAISAIKNGEFLELTVGGECNSLVSSSTVASELCNGLEDLQSSRFIGDVKEDQVAFEFLSALVGKVQKFIVQGEHRICATIMNTFLFSAVFMKGNVKFWMFKLKICFLSLQMDFLSSSIALCEEFWCNTFKSIDRSTISFSDQILLLLNCIDVAEIFFFIDLEPILKKFKDFGSWFLDELGDLIRKGKNLSRLLKILANDSPFHDKIIRLCLASKYPLECISFPLETDFSSLMKYALKNGAYRLVDKIPLDFKRKNTILRYLQTETGVFEHEEFLSLFIKRSALKELIDFAERRFPHITDESKRLNHYISDLFENYPQYHSVILDICFQSIGSNLCRLYSLLEHLLVPERFIIFCKVLDESIKRCRGLSSKQPFHDLFPRMQNVLQKTTIPLLRQSIMQFNALQLFLLCPPSKREVMKIHIINEATNCLLLFNTQLPGNNLNLITELKLELITSILFDKVDYDKLGYTEISIPRSRFWFQVTQLLWYVEKNAQSKIEFLEYLTFIMKPVAELNNLKEKLIKQEKLELHDIQYIWKSKMIFKYEILQFCKHLVDDLLNHRVKSRRYVNSVIDTNTQQMKLIVDEEQEEKDKEEKKSRKHKKKNQSKSGGGGSRKVSGYDYDDTIDYGSKSFQFDDDGDEWGNT